MTAQATTAKQTGPARVLAELDKGRTKPAYLLFGEEYFHRRSLLIAIRQAVLKDGDAAMCLSEYDGREVTLAKVLDDLRTMTFFGGMRLVAVEHADAFVSDNKDALARYVQSPSKTGCLVLVCDEKPNANLKLMKELAKTGGAIECDRPKNWELVPWIIQRANFYEKKISRQGAQALAGIVGADLAQLDSHLQTLAAFVGTRKTITDEDVLSTVDDEKVVQVWDLMDGVANKNGKLALESLDRLLPRFGMETARLALIGSTLLKLRAAKLIMEKTRSEAQAVKALKMHPYAAKKAIEQAAKFTRVELETGIRKAFATDLAIKNGHMDARLGVEKLIIELCT